MQGGRRVAIQHGKKNFAFDSISVSHIYLCMNSSTTNKKINILKLSVFVGNHIKEIMGMTDRLLREMILLHCCYDKPYDRMNMTVMYKKNKN